MPYASGNTSTAKYYKCPTPMPLSGNNRDFPITKLNAHNAQGSMTAWTGNPYKDTCCVGFRRDQTYNTRYNMDWAGATWPMTSETPHSINAPRNIIQM